MAERSRSRTPPSRRRRSPSPYTRKRSPSPYSRRRSPSPYTRKRSPSSPSKRSPSPYRRKRSTSRDRSPPKKREQYRSSDNDNNRRRRSPNRYGGRYDDRQNTEIDGIPVLPGESFSEYRIRVRNTSVRTIWASSPKHPIRSPSPKRHKKSSGSSKRRRDDNANSDDSSDNNDSDSDENRKSRRHHKSSSKHKKSKSSGRSHRSSRHGKSSSSNRKTRHSEDESDERSGDERKKNASRKEKEGKPVLEVEPSHLDAVEDLWVEKKVELPDDIAPVGPVPLVENDEHDDRAYGGALLPGEGSAMAAYVKEGKRIPRRGEIGLSGDQIADYEGAGYVMSGSRHQRMNAVRLRKENQVISAEEKRLVLQHAQEQKVKRENEIISGFREILSDKFKKEQ